MNAIATIHGGNAIATDGQLDVRAMMRHYTAPFEAAVPYEDVIEIVRKSTTRARKSKNERRSAAIAIGKAAAGHLDAITEARDRLSVALTPPDEEDIRAVIAAMLMAFPDAQPTTASPRFIDTLTMEIREDRYSLPAIAATARECWRTLPSPPAISQFLAVAEKHQTRLEGVLMELGEVADDYDWAVDIEPTISDVRRFEDTFG
jgi:hypothetical protein